MRAKLFESAQASASRDETKPSATSVHRRASSARRRETRAKGVGTVWNHHIADDIDRLARQSAQAAGPVPLL